MLESVEWGEFRIGDLFEIGTGSLLNSSELTKGSIHRISAMSDNNGVLGQFDTLHNVNARHFENFISVNFFGSDGGIFYHPYKASVEMKVHTLKLRNVELNSRTGNFIAAALKPVLDGFSYGSQLSSSKLKNGDFKLQLPVKNGQLNLDFMEDFVAELEAQRSAELEAYLSATGLKDYALTVEEQQALAQLGQQQWGEFNLKNLFGKAMRGKRLKSADRISGCLPFVTAGEADTGISAFIGNDVERFKANTITIDMFGSAKYRNYEYGGDDHIAVVHTDKLNPMAVLFITSAIHKSSYNGQFNYGRNFYAKDADALNILLPEKQGSPDFAYMQTLLSAVQKLVIKDVVQYVDKKIAATQSIILQNNQVSG
ncbi:restriction endonuclease subunit S [Neisseria animaloris]|uniref:Restriction enzyme BgcI subunit beta n=1 Tax=Neisseria animaloris TaxID=326522 RepID=A0A3S4ZAT1_9NEIS|nr:restriction endonuclease subunit S [Neisseria animaloris]VEJ20452.1 Restriction enzyme BgcI subunit beta [Neisseria animaloris]